jgi:hypothetical protein
MLFIAWLLGFMWLIGWGLIGYFTVRAIRRYVERKRRYTVVVDVKIPVIWPQVKTQEAGAYESFNRDEFWTNLSSVSKKD